jgi:hypothetical protein
MECVVWCESERNVPTPDRRTKRRQGGNGSLRDNQNQEMLGISILKSVHDNKLKRKICVSTRYEVIKIQTVTTFHSTRVLSFLSEQTTKNLTKIKMVAVLFKIIYFVRERLLRVYLH